MVMSKQTKKTEAGTLKEGATLKKEMQLDVQKKANGLKGKVTSEEAPEVVYALPCQDAEH